MEDKRLGASLLDLSVKCGNSFVALHIDMSVDLVCKLEYLSYPEEGYSYQNHKLQHVVEGYGVEHHDRGAENNCRNTVEGAYRAGSCRYGIAVECRLTRSLEILNIVVYFCLQ